MQDEPTIHCARCRRAAPPQDSDESLEWEAIDETGDEVICPGCVTLAEEMIIATDADETARRADDLMRAELAGEGPASSDPGPVPPGARYLRPELSDPGPASRGARPLHAVIGRADAEKLWTDLAAIAAAALGIDEHRTSVWKDEGRVRVVIASIDFVINTSEDPDAVGAAAATLTPVEARALAQSLLEAADTAH